MSATVTIIFLLMGTILVPAITSAIVINHEVSTIWVLRKLSVRSPPCRGRQRPSLERNCQRIRFGVLGGSGALHRKASQLGVSVIV